MNENTKGYFTGLGKALTLLEDMRDSVAQNVTVMTEAQALDIAIRDLKEFIVIEATDQEV